MQPYWGVLVVSSHPDDHQQLREVLEPCGWSVESALDPEAAGERLASETISVVLTDSEFAGGRSWRDVLDFALAAPEAPTVIVMSPRADAELWSEALALGVYDILLKPLDGGEVRCAVDFARPVEAAPIGLMKGVVMVLIEPELQASAATVLRRDGYYVLTPTRSTAARLLQLVNVAVVITDDPERLGRVRPDTRILYASASPDPEVVRTLPQPAGVLDLPFEAEELLAEVARLLRKPAGASARQRYRPTRLALRRSYLIATSIESGPSRCSTRAIRKPAFRVHPIPSAQV